MKAAFLALCLILILSPTASAASGPALEWVQGGYTLSGAANVGVGVRLYSDIKLVLIADIGPADLRANASLAYVHPGSMFLLRRPWAGVGATYHVDDKATYLHFQGGVEFGIFYSDYQIVLADPWYSAARMGIRVRL